MRVAIAGGHGKIALETARLLDARGDQALALTRSPEQAEDIRAAGGEPAICDLELDDVAAVAAAVAGCDAVIFAAGAGPGSGPERKETVDYGAAVKLIAAAHEAGIRRYLMISAMAADPDHPGEQVFDVYLRAKGRADAELARSGLDYTIVRPGALSDERPRGSVRVGERVGRGQIPRADVAALLIACLDSDAVHSRAFEVISGEVPIEAAIHAI